MKRLVVSLNRLLSKWKMYHGGLRAYVEIGVWLVISRYLCDLRRSGRNRVELDYRTWRWSYSRLAWMIPSEEGSRWKNLRSEGEDLC